jgi:hypothetical protein
MAPGKPRKRGCARHASPDLRVCQWVTAGTTRRIKWRLLIFFLCYVIYKYFLLPVEMKKTIDMPVLTEKFRQDGSLRKVENRIKYNERKIIGNYEKNGSFYT